MSQYPSTPPPFRPQDHPQTTTILILGHPGTGRLWQVLGPFAWSMGNKALREIDASNGQLGGRDTVNVGRILGMIATIILGVAVVVNRRSGRGRDLLRVGLRRPLGPAGLPGQPGSLQLVLDAQPLRLVVQAIGQVRQRGRDAQRRGSGHQHPVVRRQDALLPDRRRLRTRGRGPPDVAGAGWRRDPPRAVPSAAPTSGATRPTRRPSEVARRSRPRACRKQTHQRQRQQGEPDDLRKAHAGPRCPCSEK